MSKTLNSKDDSWLTWYWCQTDFERSVTGAMLDIAMNYAEGAQRHLEERNLYIRKLRAENRASRASQPWDPDPITAHPRHETRNAGGNLPSLDAYEKKAYVERRLLSMERMGHRQGGETLGRAHGPVGCYFDDRRLPRRYALLLFTEPGLKFLDKAFRLLEITAVGAKLEKDGKPVPASELGERALAHHEQMALHCERLRRGEHEKRYASLRELFARADVDADKGYGEACVAWNAASALVEATRGKP